MSLTALTTSLLILLHLCELTSAIVSIWYFNTSKKEARYFTLYLCFIVLAELIGYLLRLQPTRIYNTYFFSFFVIPMEYIFFYWFLIYTSFQKKYYWFSVSMSIVYIASIVLEQYYKKDFAFLSLSYVMGAIGMLLSILINFSFHLNHKQIYEIKAEPTIYISIGLLIFYIGTFPYYGMKNYLYTHYVNVCIVYRFVQMVFNCIMYCMFTYSFLCRKRKYISS